jgi:maltose alpha-D-glucosyltransferase/alpha-amylase
MHDAGTCDRLFTIVAGAQEIVTSLGSVRGRPQPAAKELALPASPHRTWTLSVADQSNSVAFSDDERVLKLFRREEPGPSPEHEVGRVLAEQRFTRTPPFVGALEYHRRGFEPSTLAIAQKQITHQGSGWDYTIDELRRYYERLATQPSGPPGDSSVPALYLRSAALLGRRTAELHLALSASEDPAFRPEPLDAIALDALVDGMHARARATLDSLHAGWQTLPDSARPQAEALLAVRAALVSRFDEIRRLGEAGLRTRIHGDYHLGQVLRTEEDFFILDFEGEPARPLAERRAKQSPLRDVAGMLRSYGYAAYAALFAFAVRAPDDFALLESWAGAWQRSVADAFVREYRSALGSSPIVPGPEHDAAFFALLMALTLDKALHELSYELNNRPEWVRIPLAGLLAMST